MNCNMLGGYVTLTCLSLSETLISRRALLPLPLVFISVTIVAWPSIYVHYTISAMPCAGSTTNEEL